MAFEFRLTNFLNKRKWIIPTLFAIMCVLFVVTIVTVEVRGIEKIPTDFAFSIGGELCAIVIAIMMTLSILPAYKRQSGYIRIFVTVLTVGCLCLFSDSVQMVIDGIPELTWLNTVMCIFVFMNIAAFLFFFFLYACQALKSEGRIMKTLKISALVLLIVFMLLPFVNIFYPLYFTIDPATGIYARNKATWWISQIYLVVIVIAITISIFLSKESLKTKIIIMVFVALPVLAILSGGYHYGVSIQYTAMMVSLVLIYAFLYSDNEKHLYSTNKELNVATNIQKHMLPSIFPAFPDRKEFDVYASMNPAKEVGGDFYDFFLIDDDHLGLVMADVSDKGIPAALFMMASKIMVQNYTMLGQSPKEVLTSVNKQICQNNQEGMFVTIWLGILDVKTGIITASNAGHEKPVIKRPDGQFEIYTDKHAFVVGWSDMAVYSEYEIKLEKGSKLFVYTDGVPEAYNGSVRFGMDNMLRVLNELKELPPKEILTGMTDAINAFAGKQDQFDDTTMLCLEYKGYDNE